RFLSSYSYAFTICPRKTPSSLADRERCTRHPALTIRTMVTDIARSAVDWTLALIPLAGFVAMAAAGTLLRARRQRRAHREDVHGGCFPWRQAASTRAGLDEGSLAVRLPGQQPAAELMKLVQ